jgi:hypothetical protein
MPPKFAAIVFLLFPAFSGEITPATPDLVAHEWGTFTSVADENGLPVSWAALSAPSDLPCFVYRLSAQCVKCNATSTVRMETPVLYFYGPHTATVSVHVDLPSGVITEWYPKATGVPSDVTYGNGGKIDWGPVQITPGAMPMLINDGSDSHYYPARNTDSAALRVDNEEEKLLFYRGIAEKGVALDAQLMDNGTIELRNRGTDTIPFAVVFENRGGKAGYRLWRYLDGKAAVPLPDLTDNVKDLHRDLADALMDAGLFPKEANAMIDTWRDSWFEEGMRVFYILSRKTVDDVLPLKITPAPASVVRAFVGRVEVFSPAVREALKTALATGDTATLAKCSRFLEPFLARLRGVAIAPRAATFLNAMRAQNSKYRVEPCKEQPAIPTNNN